MIDQRLGPLYHRLFLSFFLPYLKKIHPTTITLIGCLFGMLSIPFISFKWPIFATLVLLISGFLDTLDGTLARHRQLTSPQGAVLDIVCDRIVEFSVVLGLYLADPNHRGLLTLFMLGSILLCVTTFLVIGIFTPNQGKKSFYYSAGLIERAEAFIFFFFMILIPSSFFTLACLFATLTTLTAFIRCKQFLTHFQS